MEAMSRTNTSSSYLEGVALQRTKLDQWVRITGAVMLIMLRPIGQKRQSAIAFQLNGHRQGHRQRQQESR